MPRKSRNGKRRTTSRRNRSMNVKGEATGPSGHPNMSRWVPPSNYLKDNVAGISQSIRRTLTFTTGAIYNFSTSAYAEPAVVVLNSAYIPCNALASGVSSTGFLKYMAFYTKCFVMAARIKVKVVNYLVTEVQPALIGVTITTNSTSLGGYPAAIEAGLCDYDAVGTNPDHRIFNNSIDVGRFLNKPTVLDDPQLFSTISVSPSQLICAHLWLGPFVAGGNIAFIIELEQDCIFTDPTPFS
jgi:hypothetical protein